MSVSDVQEMWSKQSSAEESPDGKTFTTTYTRGFQVSHSLDATQDEIRNAPGISIRSSYSTSNPYVYCTKIGDVQKLGPGYSVVIFQYKGESGPQSQSPLNKPPDIRYYTISQEVDADVDAYGFPITNVNGEPVAGVKRTIHDMVLQVRRNFATVSGSLGLRYMDSVNSDNILYAGDVWQPGQGTLTKFAITPVKGDVISYYTVDAEITLRQAYLTIPARAWWARYRNEGTKVRVDTEVAFLSGSGTGAAGYVITNPSTGAITKVVVTNRGKNYASASVSFTSAEGTGATATANVNTSTGEIESVTVTGGGTGYKTQLVQATESGKPVTKPILLNAAGKKEPDASLAIWLERPVKQYNLPYAVLGLI